MGGREAPWFAACMGCVLSLADVPQLPLALSDSALCWRIRQIAAASSIKGQWRRFVDFWGLPAALCPNPL